ncbi:ABC transporter substrate-binding protein [Bradyrhizobium sp. NP1]|uniref:ABC transporter substrate-binding protein n=1 Tax=Bradyrhizobium sp. NP1 TaxID=3049772 RepID=UPI0025A56F5C|nr:ABC transporter substrate-binding protein [Bradyrhizobium sp. NP1]WJR76656.1 ABC transporter substrate-binding protein [Bradyrhizobium sp. NP1]
MYRTARRSLFASGFALTTALMFSGLAGNADAADLTPASLRLKWLPQAQFAGYYVAKAKGFYSDEGIALTINPGGPNIIAENMVGSNTDTFGHGGGMASLLQAREKGLPIVGIGMLFQETPYRLVALEKAGIKKFTDLKGKTVSTWFTGPQFMVQAMLKANGIDRDVNLEAQANSMVPFIDGKVDVATVTVYNELLILKRRNVTPAVMFNPADMGINLANEAIIVNESTIKDNPKLVQGFLRASLKGWVYAMTHKDEALDILLKEVPTLNRTEQMETLEALQPLLTYGAGGSKGIGYIDRDNLAFAQKFLLDNGALKKAVDLDSSINTTFWDKVPASDKVIPR